MTRKKKTRGKPGPKPGFQPVVNIRRAAARAAAAPTVTEDDEAYIAAVRKDPLRQSRRLRDMEHAELRLYAKGLRIPQHNIDELTVDKLRINCQLQVGAILEAFTGD